ncbi:hypothetical protein AM1_F0080 (plasmid) [Acaryochloris marina MBIC11017]|uniref:Uncharacterized protein n=1 Tax=Acaryochloris marina (strain MBIC 11017) TaxID=329726 RepID=A8ZQ62_ACAM1|nr:hypothetical protein AM1_F0080 [Acaryochloris marina MBIC11017]
MELQGLPTQPLMQIAPAPPVRFGGRLFTEKAHHLTNETQKLRFRSPNTIAENGEN